MFNLQPRFHRARKVFAVALVAVAVYGVIGAGVIPLVVRRISERWLSNQLGRRVTIASLAINPFALSVRILGFSVARHEPPLPGEQPVLFGFDELYVNAQLISLLNGGPVLRRITLRGPQLHVVQTPEGKDNVSDVVARLQARFSHPPDPNDKPARFSLNNIEIDRGHATWVDGPRHASHRLDDLFLDIPFLSNLPVYVHTFVSPRFSVRIDGTTLALGAQAQPFSESHDSHVELQIRALDLRRLIPYQPSALRVGLRSGHLDGKLRVTFATERVGTDRPEDNFVVRIDGGLTLSDFDTVDGSGRPLVRFAKLSVDIADFEPLISKLQLRRVRLDAPEIELSLDRLGRLNFAQLVAESPEVVTPRSTPARPAKVSPAAPSRLRLAVERLEVRAGRLRYVDQSGREPFATQLSGVEIDVDHYVFGSRKPAELSLAFRTDADESAKLTAKIALAPFSAQGQLELSGLLLSRYRPYYASALRARAPSGRLSVGGRLRLEQAEDAEAKLGIAVEELRAELSDLRIVVAQEREPLLVLPKLVLEGGSLDLAGRRLRVGALTTSGGRLRVERDSEGVVNLTTLAAATTSAPETRTSSQSTNGADRPWRLELDKLLVEGWRVGWRDRSLVSAGAGVGGSAAAAPDSAAAAAPAVRAATPGVVELAFDGIRLGVTHFSLPAVGKAHLDFAATVNQGGKIHVVGELAAAPLAAELRLELRNLALVPFQPYALATSPILLTSGTVSLDAKVSGGLDATGAPKGSLFGELALERISVLPKGAQEELVRWRALQVDGISARVAPNAPLRLDIKQVALAGFTGGVVVRPDGTLNLEQLAPPAPPASKAAPTAATQRAATPPPEVKIGRVAVNDATVRFVDRSVSPAFSMTLGDLRSNVTGLSSEKGTKASVEASATIDGNAPLSVAGTVNPLADEPHLDVGIQVKDVELPPASPYAGKFAGYRLDKGKLALDLRYLIQGRQLEAQNRIFIDQLTFGEHVESPTATKLPVRLAVALLKDRHGEIHLDVPVRGSLDDPEFSVWRLVWQVVKNLMVKAATSPFALIGSAFSGDDQMSAVEFESGTSTPTASGAKGLAMLGKVLAERPSLEVELEGHVDPVADREGLKQRLVDQRIKAEKLHQLAADGQPSVGLDKLSVAPEEVETYLRRAYEAQPMERPRNLLGRPKKIGVEEMRQRLAQALSVSDGDLRLLAIRRAEAVKQALLIQHGVAAARLFLVEPKQLAPESRSGTPSGLRASRVDLTLR